MINSLSPNLLSEMTYDIISNKSLKEECDILLSQIEELRNNYHSMIMNKYNREYTFINDQRLTHIVPYKSSNEVNVEKCKALCSSDENCYGFNKSINYSFFNNKRVNCDYISKKSANTLGVISKYDPDYKLYINMSDDNIKTTKRILDNLISTFFSKCNRNMDIIEAYTGIDKISSQNSDIFLLKADVLQQRQKMNDIMNDILFIDKEYSNSNIGISHNNVMLSIYTFIVIILIIISIKSIVNI